MGDPLQPIQPGDPIEEAFRTDRWNAVLAAARKVQRLDAVGAGPPAPSPWTPASLVHVTNTTGGTLPVFAIVTPSGTLVDPESESFQAMRQPVFHVSAPVTENDVVFVVFDDADNNGIARAVISGGTVCRVDVTDTTHRFARPIVGNIFQLQSAESGQVRLLQTFGDTGVKMCYVSLLGGGGSGEVNPAEVSGCDWVDALTEDDCLSFALESAAGRCGCAETFTPLLLTYQSADDGGTWGTGEMFTICGVKYIPTFKKEACNGPCLTLTSVPEGSFPCCDPEDEGTEESVAWTVVKDGVTYTGNLILAEDGCWRGVLEAEEPPEPGPTCGSSGPIPAATPVPRTIGATEEWWSFAFAGGGDIHVEISAVTGSLTTFLWRGEDCMGGLTAITSFGGASCYTIMSAPADTYRIEVTGSPGDQYTVEWGTGAC